MTQNLDRFKFKGFYKNALYECFSFCDEFVKLVIDGNIIKVLRNEVILIQSTGLKDKNGKLIYENDIILSKQGKEKLYDVVKWYKTGYFGICEGELGIGSPLFITKCEVIGNIYENQDLAKEHNLI